MKDIITDIVKTAKTINTILDELIKSSSTGTKQTLVDMKEQNTKNYRLLINLYEITYKKGFSKMGKPSITLSDNYAENLDLLFENIIVLLTYLDKLKQSAPNLFANQVVQNIINNYLRFATQISYIYSKLGENRLEDSPKKDNSSTIEDGRNLSIDAINVLFNYKLTNDIILDERVDTFYEDNPEYKFYQYIFETEDRFFKTRVSAKDNLIFYMYQSIKNATELPNIMTEEEAKQFVNDYLSERIPDKFSKLVLDKEYLDICSYSGRIECYVFKFNGTKPNGEIDPSKGLYVTVDTRYGYIPEITIFYY